MPWTDQNAYYRFLSFLWSCVFASIFILLRSGKHFPSYLRSGLESILESCLVISQKCPLIYLRNDPWSLLEASPNLSQKRPSVFQMRPSISQKRPSLFLRSIPRSISETPLDISQKYPLIYLRSVSRSITEDPSMYTRNVPLPIYLHLSEKRPPVYLWSAPQYICIRLTLHYQ